MSELDEHATEPADVEGVSTDEVVRMALDEAGNSSLPADSAVYVEGDGLRKIMFGVDIGAAELLLARDLGCDAVIAHHPPGGSAMLHFPRVLIRHVELMVDHGIPAIEARAAVDSLISRSVLSAQAANLDRVPSAARLLEMPFLNLHLPLDEIGRRIMVETIYSHVETVSGLPRVQDAVHALYTLPEFASASTKIMVPAGALDNPLGRFAVVHGAGTNGGFRIAKCYFDHSVRTVIYIHVAPDDADRLRRETSGNLIVTGHIAADMIGINAFIEMLEERGVEVVRAGGA